MTEEVPEISERIAALQTQGPATPAPSNLYCWLWAAFVPKAGRLNVPRVAAGLGVSPTTIRRWVRDPATDLTRPNMVMLHRRAILRGRGSYLWPAVDATSMRRSQQVVADAEWALTQEPTERDRETGRTQPHTVAVVFYPRAHVFGLTAHQTVKHTQRIRNHGGITLETGAQPSYWSAVLLREKLLHQVGTENRVVAPSDMVRNGRTYTWLERVGRISLNEQAAG